MSADENNEQLEPTENIEDSSNESAEQNDAASTATIGGAAHDVQNAEFENLVEENVKPVDASLRRFLDVQVTVTAELGRVDLPIGDLVKLGEGSVVELKQPINSPIELMAQGVRIATGEVVVVDECFGIRIKEIDSDNPIGK